MPRNAARIWTAFSTSVREKLGVCSTCIRASFVLAGLAWVIVLVAESMLSIALAILLTALAGAHVVAFAVRTAKRRVDPAPEGCTGCSSRRGFLRAVAGAVPLVFLARFLAGAPPAGAQVLSCAHAIPPLCGGTCPPLFDGAGQPVLGAVCVPRGGGCVCEFTRADPNCHKQANNRCGGTCAPLYKSADDAKHDKNRIDSHCVHTRPGVCECVYTF